MPKSGAAFTGPVGGGRGYVDAEWGRVVTMGILQFGQSREVVVPMKIPEKGPYLEVVVTYTNSAGNTVRASCLASERVVSIDAQAAAM
eukprot:CAMPEP_0117592606 /NCGR_PEP_ID=MMETSP0784-20121206/72163_1 /TAXON_ID=39447 /ORGANISM="" /LENGTH=87 /DNA_ID=CAMNT_0005394421 /DNA_START=27 /DNA_END=287 /DNA_ORIENTATION=-